MKPELSVVTPCYNEELSIRECVVRLSNSLVEFGISFEHILVNNASVDGTLEVLKELKKEFPHVRVLDNEFNVGAFRSMQRGITAAQGHLIIPFLAADCQDPPEVIPQMLRIRRETNCDTVAGVRKSRHDGLLISLFRKMFYRVLLLATKGRYKSGASEFRLMTTASALQLAAVQDSTPFLRVYMAQIQGRVVYLDYEMAERNAGVSSTSFFPLVDDALNGIMLAAVNLLALSGLSCPSHRDVVLGCHRCCHWCLDWLVAVGSTSVAMCPGKCLSDAGFTPTSDRSLLVYGSLATQVWTECPDRRDIGQLSRVRRVSE
jgi:hypothetical protein